MVYGIDLLLHVSSAIITSQLHLAIVHVVK